MVMIGKKSHVNMLTVASISAPANPISIYIDDFRLAFLNFKEKIAIISVDAMLDFSPQENGDGLIVHVDGLAIFVHCA